MFDVIEEFKRTYAVMQREDMPMQGMFNLEGERLKALGIPASALLEQDRAVYEVPEIMAYYLLSQVVSYFEAEDVGLLHIHIAHNTMLRFGGDLELKLEEREKSQGVKSTEGLFNEVSVPKNPMQVMVEEFMTICEQVVRRYPQLATEEERNLRAELMLEELSGTDELLHSMLKGDLVGIADGLADLLYVVFGTAAAYGINVQDIFNEVHRSNLTKAIWDEATQTYILNRSESGKIIKPESYSPADLKPLIDRQIAAGRWDSVDPDEVIVAELMEDD